MSAVLRQPTSDMMIEVDPHQYVNWLSAMQNGLIVKNALSSKRQYLRREMGIENAATDAHDTHLALKESREGAIFGAPRHRSIFCGSSRTGSESLPDTHPLAARPVRRTGP